MGLIDFTISSAYYVFFIILIFFLMNTYVQNFLYHTSLKYCDFREILQDERPFFSFSKDYIGCAFVFNNTFCNYVNMLCSFNYTGELFVLVDSTNYSLKYKNCTCKKETEKLLHIKCNMGSFCVECYDGDCMISKFGKFRERKFYKLIEDYIYALYVRR